MRFLGVSVPDRKSVYIALTYVYGISFSSAEYILDACEIGRDIRMQDLSGQDVLSLSSYIEKHYVIEGELRKKVVGDIKFLISISCYRGVRHRSSLPVRGQRTHTNARTRKGRARVALAGKKK